MTRCITWTVLIGILVLLGNVAYGVTYYVDASRPDDLGDGRDWEMAKRTIQAAVDLMSDGDILWVTNGVYDAGGGYAAGTSSAF